MSLCVTISSIFLLFDGFSADKALGASSLNLEAQNRAKWISSAFDHRCVKDCKVFGSVPSYEADSNANRNCTVQCNRGEVTKQLDKNELWINVQLRNKNNRARSECRIGVLPEDVFCATASPHSSGVRKYTFADPNPCQRKFRYFLPRPICVDRYLDEVGEQTCQKACAPQTRTQTTQVVDVSLKRATFRVCYKETFRQTRRIRNRMINSQKIVKYCRAELSPCSSCFRWGNWTTTTPCSKTCGSPGIVIYRRTCFIIESTGLYGEKVTMSRISNLYCQAHFGGMDSKTEQCGSYTDCPEWTKWGQWSGCVVSDTVMSSNSDVTAKRRCRTRQKRDADSDVASTNSASATTVEPIVINPMSSPAAGTFPMSNGFLTLKSQKGSKAYRSRRCLLRRSTYSLCVGNSTEYRPCDTKERSPTDPTMTPTTSNENCDDKTGDGNEISVSNSTEVQSDIATSAAKIDVTAPSFRPESTRPTLGPKVHPGWGVGNDNYTASDDGGFTTLLNTYAPALIAGLLIFVVLLLVALIAICGTRMMQRSRRIRYDVTSPPSLSAGTMGSIPSGLVHGFSHVLGLRHGSGTFGRSEGYVTGYNNASDALSNRGSCRSVTSNNNRSQHRPQIPPALGLAYASNPILHHSPHQRIALSEFSKRPMGSKKPSNSSLLSSASSTGGTPHSASPNPCSFPPLPPIPPDKLPHPVGNDNSVFKRGSGRSSSLNPAESDRNTSMKCTTQPRSDSVGGRVTGRSQALGGDVATLQRFLRTPETRSRSSSRGTRHCDETSTSENGSEANRAVENEYWSVTRSDCLHSDDESPSPSRKSTDSRGRRSKYREMKTVKPIQAEKARGSHASLTAKLSHEMLVEEEDGSDMVENILYAHSANISACHSHDEAEERLESIADEDDESSAPSVGGLSSSPVTKEPFYNAITSQSDKAKQVMLSEDDYDHLCDQFGGINSTKGRAKYPGRMTSLHYLPAGDKTKPHDYESIELGGRKLAPK